MKRLALLLLALSLTACDIPPEEQEDYSPPKPAPQQVKPRYAKQTVLIYSLSLENEIAGHMHGEGSLEGSFFLGMGNISGASKVDGSIANVPVYWFYRAGNNGGYILARVNAETVEIVRTDSQKPSWVITSQIISPYEQHLVSNILYVPTDVKFKGEFSKKVSQ